ncbi:sugar phosphate isomerase/epimerase family protein [Pseudogracilibacillus auburnensis]|uniref:sugar phosphate isomerase/epimerase family protein n=1 Tax=Pseudogracilibacillus auburnensis TaxID=1494959 RepID=UPI001A966134|nr:TIM barrel protein [Pseudogracilibacillus auburnensis]MBO1005334.1 TIM barrel protein [Pseudogracilibacillus auburnensis]
MKLSIGGYSFFNTHLEDKMDIFGYLETVRYRYGLDSIDFWNGQFAKGDFSYIPEDSYVQKIREALDERELTLVNYAVDGAHIWHSDPEERERLYERALQHFHIAEILGAKTVRIDTGGVFASQDGFDISMSDEQFEYIVKRYKEFSERGANNGYMVGPENHIGPSLSPIQMKKIAEAVDHPNYGILLHLDRWQEEADKGDEIVAPWVYHTHFDARTAKAEDAEDKVKMLIENGYDGYWGIEHNAEKNQYIETEWLISSVKRILANVEQ